MEIKKPQTFEEVLNLQKILDEEVAKPRENGFVPRKRSWLDISLSIDDELQEWLKELPKEFNFKTWKEKVYSREKELEELTDVLFFFLQFANIVDDITRIGFKLNFDEDYSNVDELISREYEVLTRHEPLLGVVKINFNNIFNIILAFKKELWDFGIPIRAFKFYWIIVYKRGFTKEEILNTYFTKWKKNMERIKGDWTLSKVKEYANEKYKRPSLILCGK